VAKYPGDSGTAIKAMAEELLARLAAANAPGAAPPAPATAAPAAIEPSVTS
jgi:hypothetical protein